MNTDEPLNRARAVPFTVADELSNDCEPMPVRIAVTRPVLGSVAIFRVHCRRETPAMATVRRCPLESVCRGSCGLRFWETDVDLVVSLNSGACR